jgi:hypothetical protein
MVERAAEQLAEGRHTTEVPDSWEIKSEWRKTQAPKYKRRTRCWECGLKPYRKTSYCKLHGYRVSTGQPVDRHLYFLTTKEKKILSSGRKFAGPLLFGG